MRFPRNRTVKIPRCEIGYCQNQAIGYFTGHPKSIWHHLKNRPICEECATTLQCDNCRRRAFSGYPPTASCLDCKLLAHPWIWNEKLEE